MTSGALVKVIGNLATSTKEAALPNRQVFIIGRSECLADVPFATLSHKFGNFVSEATYQSALGMQKDNISLYLNNAYIVSLPTKLSRNNCPANPLCITKSLTTLASSRFIDIILVSKMPHVLASISAIARSFPLYSRKTNIREEPQEINIEVLVLGGQTLVDEDVIFLNDAIRAVRVTAKLVDMPTNELHTDEFVKIATALADELGDSVTQTVIRGDDLKRQGFGGIYSVGQAAIHPPAFVVLSCLRPQASSTYALVGKGIVYDTGGLSLKTKTQMPGMKRDCGGAAAVLMAFWLAVKAGFKQNLHCCLCLAENQISPSATRPDDIITMLSGKTVEVNNTDAEGRLVLGDGVFYAFNTLKADVIIDLATLTGAQATATGKYHAGIVTNNSEWEWLSVCAGRASGDLTFPLVYCPELHFSELKSEVADMKNSKLEGPSASSSVAALFIQSHINFDSSVVWLHVDMAAPVHQGERATGYGPPLVLTMLADKTDPPVLKCLADFMNEMAV